MTDLHKQQIVELIIINADHLGSNRAVATKCDVSSALISQAINNNWENISNKAWSQIGASLGWQPNDEWKIVDTMNTRQLESFCLDAKEDSLFLAISHPAGGGKSAGANKFFQANKLKSVYRMRCREWTGRQYLEELCRVLGIEHPRGYVSTDKLLTLVVQFFLTRAVNRPLLILDEADKLKATALRTLIPLFNETEDRLGVIIIGTENLEKEIKRGVRYNKKGFDEIDSRLGRKYIKLQGATFKEVQRICTANGIADKKHQRRIWDECVPREIDGFDEQGERAFIDIIDDLRRVKKIIKRDLINLAYEAA